MQVFFALSCVLAVLAVTNGASIAPNSEKEVRQPRAGDEVQDAVVSASETRRVTETAGQPRAAEKTNKEVAAEDAVTSDGAGVEVQSATVANNSDNQGTTSAVRRVKRTFLRRLGHGCGHLHHGATCGSGGCADQVVQGCAGVGCNSGCGGTTPCAPNTVVVHQDVPVDQPVPVQVPVLQIVHQDVPIPKPVPVPVVKVVRVPVPVLAQSTPCCTQPKPCCGQPPLPCSPCSG